MQWARRAGADNKKKPLNKKKPSGTKYERNGNGYQNMISSVNQVIEYQEPDFVEPIGEVIGVWNEIDEQIEGKCSNLFDRVNNIKDFHKRHGLELV